MKIKIQREQNKKFDEQIKVQNRIRMQCLRKKVKEQARKQLAKQREMMVKTKKSEMKTYKLSKTKRKTESAGKKIQRIGQALPEDRNEWANTVNILIDQASPRRKSLLHFQSNVRNRWH